MTNDEQLRAKPYLELMWKCPRCSYENRCNEVSIPKDESVDMLREQYQIPDHVNVEPEELCMAPERATCDYCDTVVDLDYGEAE